MSQQPPEIRGEVPGKSSQALLERLHHVECPEVSAMPGAIFWERANGSNVWDADGNRYVDLLAGFGVAAIGHAHPEATRALQEQAAVLPHALSDVHPATVRVALLESLTRRLPADLGMPILSASGSDAVESALKTALVVTGRAHVVAFEDAYHGLGLGALDATHAALFREPFAERLPGRTTFVRFGDADAVRRAVRADAAGAILVEPVQGRGGAHPAPAGFLSDLRAIADDEDALLIADEVYTGLGRTGRWLACEHDGVVPDLVTVGKALGGGFPISACAGRPGVMKGWGERGEEARHTSTHLGNPLGCAVACAVLDVLARDDLPGRAAEVGERWLANLRSALAPLPGVVDVRGRGLMLGIELDTAARAARVVEDALASGWILIQEGPDGRVLSLTPPLNVAESLLEGATARLAELLSA
ncbi:MAG: aspartate aminotransferase family protein [Deltaproteobacteria bacterium]|nr:aspartate aminotransferase family protein [Deltaproteobacteria bacterium]MBW2413201.1 aspartate aminotransferase family protein [Deltaproteobacteria bacterium]